ncbi:hypothetical protein FM113_17720 [Leucobacter sp. 7(1)]|nr:hypothetical protein FM113_17720 [Leucobacter sp. 7(1)]
MLVHLAPDMKDWLASCDHAEELLADQLALDALNYARLKRQVSWI